MPNTCHKCERPFEVWEASPEHPYHYTESGLPNIHLIDITVYSCPNCEVVAADIPDMDGLHDLIARDIILKPQAMTGQELRFLRKEVRFRPKEFAERMGVDPKTVKNWEASERLTKPVDLMARVLVVSELWENNQMVQMLVELGKLAKYGWEDVVQDNLEEGIAQLAAENTVLEYQDHWQFGGLS